MQTKFSVSTMKEIQQDEYLKLLFYVHNIDYDLARIIKVLH